MNIHREREKWKNGKCWMLNAEWWVCVCCKPNCSPSHSVVTCCNTSSAVRGGCVGTISHSLTRFYTRVCGNSSTTRRASSTWTSCSRFSSLQRRYTLTLTTLTSSLHLCKPCGLLLIVASARTHIATCTHLRLFHITDSQGGGTVNLLGDSASADRSVLGENVLTYVRLYAQYRLITLVQRPLEVLPHSHIYFYFHTFLDFLPHSSYQHIWMRFKLY